MALEKYELMTQPNNCFKGLSPESQTAEGYRSRQSIPRSGARLLARIAQNFCSAAKFYRSQICPAGRDLCRCWILENGGSQAGLQNWLKPERDDLARIKC